MDHQGTLCSHDLAAAGDFILVGVVRIIEVEVEIEVAVMDEMVNRQISMASRADPRTLVHAEIRL